VRFSALMSCSTTDNPDLCDVRVVEPGASVFDPASNGLNFMVENSNFETRSFEWVKILGGAGSSP